MLDPSQLSQTAHDDCRKHVELLFEGAYHVEVLNHGTAWNPRELRNVFSQSMTVWRQYGEFDVILDAQNTPVGYIDHDKWTGCAWRELTPEQVKAIVSPLDPLRADVEIRSIARGERDCLEARVGVGGVAEFLVRINPARAAIIAFIPAGSVQP